MSTFEKNHNLTPEYIADRLGFLRAQMALLAAEEEDLKKAAKKLLDDGDEVTGESFSLKRSDYLSERVDSAKVEKALGGKEAMKAAGFYKIGVTTRLTTTAVSIYENAA